MNSTLKGMLLFMAGALVGAGITYKLVCDHYEATIDDLMAEPVEEDEKKVVYEDALASMKDATIEGLRMGAPKPAQQHDYTRYSKPDLAELAEDVMKRANVEDSVMEVDEAPSEPAGSEVIEMDRPFVIDAEDFLNDKDEYEKITISYYMLDNVLADERDELINDSDYIVGDKNLSTVVPSDSPHQQYLYVRNDELETDFEIMIVEGSYQEMVLGIAPSVERGNGGNGTGV